MTQEEKQLLLIDLCARLPYKPIVHVKWSYRETSGELKHKEADRKLEINDIYAIWDIKPYLRSLSDMTKEEREEIQVFICDEWFFEDSGFATKVRREGYIEFLANYDCSGIDPEFCGEYTDWLNAHHFDYRGLIERGLALEASEGMYK